MEMPLVSIIVPVYNAQSHLSRCLESICGQEYKNLELIVINDGSKDKSLPVCEEFRKKDSRILLVDKANSGVSDTRNLGLKLASGKLYRRDILTRHDIRFTSEMRWAEDLVFNMQYIQYAEVFASIPQPGYYYVQNPQSICHTQIKPATLVQNKIQVFRYYKDLYTRLGMYEQVRPQLYKFLIDIAESTYPSGPFKKVIDEAKAYWKEHKAEISS